MREMIDWSLKQLDKGSNRLIWAMGQKTLRVQPNRPIVSFTFDDVPASSAEQGAAVLEDFGVFGTFYIAGGLIGKNYDNQTFITEQGCRDLVIRGHEIGCHTHAHRTLRSYNRSSLSRDLYRNREFLKSLDAGLAEGTGINFAYPYNAAWPFARPLLSKNYVTCRGAGQAINRDLVDPMMLRSVEICQPEAHARGLVSWIEQLVRTPGWLIYFTHDISLTPSGYGCRPDTLKNLVKFAKEHGCEILPVRDALRAIADEEMYNVFSSSKDYH